ncbi:MAG TPA: hypothetical protein VMW24_11740 [Sedimentisphaerales bacterium]|nr:hypothetical protein [Sedimentisphaerales bacterium]
MSNIQTSKCGGAALLILVLFCTAAMVNLCNAEETGTKDPPTGVLTLEGNHLDYIELLARDGHTERITRPEATLELPPGEYRLQQARLKGSYTYNGMGVPGGAWVTVAADKPATLKVGGPLVPTLKVQRQGRILRLSYELRGVGGEAYTGGDRSKPPTFAVYKGQKEVASDKLEYG